MLQSVRLTNLKFLGDDDFKWASVDAAILSGGILCLGEESFA